MIQAVRPDYYDKPGRVKYVVVFDAAGYLARID